jgi:hypothetical protein
MVPLSDSDLAWNLFVELRKEIVETQKIRAQVIGFKITFTSTAIGVIIAGSGKWPLELLALPAFAAVFFDTLIASYGVGIKRMGYYCHQHLEPVLRRAVTLPEGFLLWHEFRRTFESRKSFGFLGNVGITFLLALPAVAALGATPRKAWSLGLLGLLLLALIYDYWIIRLPQTFREDTKTRTA